MALPPHKIRDKLLVELRAVRRGYVTAEGAAALDKMSKEEKAVAGKVLIDTAIAIRKLETVQLEEIADKLKEHEKDLSDATKALGEAVKDLKKFKKAIDTAAKTLALLARIATLVGVPLG